MKITKRPGLMIAVSLDKRARDTKMATKISELPPFLEFRKRCAANNASKEKRVNHLSMRAADQPVVSAATGPRPKSNDARPEVFLSNPARVRNVNRPITTAELVSASTK